MEAKEDKKSWRQKIAERVWKPKDPGFTEKKLSGLGVDILSDQKLESRIALMVEFQDNITKQITETELENYLEELRSRLNKLNTAIYEIAVPYAASGSYPGYADMLDAWLVEYKMASSWLLRAEEIINPPKKEEGEEEYDFANLEYSSIDNNMLIRFLHDSMQKHVFADGLSVISKCFREKHVTERAAIVIQTLQHEKKFIPVGYETQQPTGEE